MQKAINDGKSILIGGHSVMSMSAQAIDILFIREYDIPVENPFEGYDDFIPLFITFDPLLDMWSYTVGNKSGVADTKLELVEKVWTLVREWEEHERS